MISDIQLREIADTKKEIDLYHAIGRLKLSSDFKLIMKEYLETKPINLIKQKALLVKDGLNADNLDNQILAIGLFSVFLDDIENNGETAINSLEQTNTEEF